MEGTEEIYAVQEEVNSFAALQQAVEEAVIVATKPLVYNYEDPGEEQWTSDGTKPDNWMEGASESINSEQPAVEPPPVELPAVVHRGDDLAEMEAFIASQKPEQEEQVCIDPGPSELNLDLPQVEENKGKEAEEADEEEEEEEEEITNAETLLNRGEGENYQDVILEDWEADGPTTDPLGEEDGDEQQASSTEDQLKVEVVHTFPASVGQVDTNKVQLLKRPRQKGEKLIGGIVSKKDVLLAMELASLPDDEPIPDSKREEIIGILESESHNGKNSHQDPNDPRLGPIINHQFGRTPGRRGRPPKQAKRPEKPKDMNKETEREIALRQLASDFLDGKRKRGGSANRTRSTKSAPVVAAADLGRVLASTPVLTGSTKRKPCYLQDEEDTPKPKLQTYMPKPKTKTDDDVEIGLQTIAIVNKHLSDAESIEEEPKQLQKKKKTPREVQNLLADEGAVRMLYEAQKEEEEQPVFKKTKKGLEQQTKYVEDAVMRLSGGTEKGLRGKKIKQNSETDGLFPPAVPDATKETPGRQKKKPKPAEASKILYRHSSSESFDGSEGLRRSASEIAGLDASPERKTEPQRKSGRPRKVSSKLSEYVAETTPKKSKRNEEVRPPITAEWLTPPSFDEKPEDKDEPASSGKSKRGPKRKTNEVRVTRSGALAELTITSSHPSIKNSFTAEVLQQLNAELLSAEKDPQCNAVLLTSQGSVFCQGVDLAQLEPGSDVSPLIHSIRSFVTTLVKITKPLIVGVQGAAVGMGVSMLPLFDVVIVSDSATFYTPYSRLGQGLEAASSYTFPLLGKSLVSELVYKGAKLSAEDSLELGLASQLVSAKEFASTVKEVAHVVASQSSQALRFAKTQLTRPHTDAILEALDRECVALESAWTSAEFIAAAAEFLAAGELILNAQSD